MQAYMKSNGSPFAVRATSKCYSRNSKSVYIPSHVKTPKVENKKADLLFHFIFLQAFW